MDLEDLILTALDHENIPPRVPSFLQGVMPYFFEKWETKFGDELDDDCIILTKIKDVTLHAHLGFDSTWCGFSGDFRTVPEERSKLVEQANEKLSNKEKEEGYHYSPNGGIYRTVTYQGYPNNFMVGGTIKTKEKWMEWFGENPGDIIEPKVDSVKEYNESKKMALSGKHKILLIPTTGLIMEPIIAMLDMGRISLFARKDPDFLHKVIAYIAEPSLRKFKLMCESDAPILMIPDDCAYKGRPTLSPKHYKEFIIPYWKKMADMAHKADKLLMMHSDGVVEPYYNDLIEAGLDIHQSVEPLAGNDLAQIKEKYGDKLSFVGNIDSSQLLSYGTSEEVINTVKNTLKAGMPNSGYMFSPCTDLLNTNSVENVEIMMATWRKYGKYPINIE